MRPRETEKRRSPQKRVREYIPAMVEKMASNRLTRWQRGNDDAWEGADSRVSLALFFILSRRWWKSEVQTEWSDVAGAWQRFCTKHKVTGREAYDLVVMVCKRDEDNHDRPEWKRAQPFMLLSKRDLDRVRS